MLLFTIIKFNLVFFCLGENSAFDKINKAHMSVMVANHPDHGGSAALDKIKEARRRVIVVNHPSNGGSHYIMLQRLTRLLSSRSRLHQLFQENKENIKIKNTKK